MKQIYYHHTLFMLFFFLFVSCFFTSYGQPKAYHFINEWKLQAGIDTVFNTVKNSKAWPAWWSSIQKVKELQAGDDDSIGNIRQYTIKSPIGYKLKFNLKLTDYIENSLVKGEATGDLIGSGAWFFYKNKDTTTVKIIWDVTPAVGWMNSFRFIIAPILKW